VQTEIPESISVPQAANVLGIHRTTVLRLINSGDFPVPTFKVGHRYRIMKGALEEYIKGNVTDTR